MVRDYSKIIPSDVKYCRDAFEIIVGQGKGVVSHQSTGGDLSRAMVRDYYLRQDEICINKSLENAHGLPRFKVFSSELEANTVDSSSIPQRLVNSMFASDLEEFQSSWCLESSINDNVIHNFIQGLYATTYVSGRFALPKDRIV